MSSSVTNKRIDPLIDAYRHASEIEAQDAGARSGAALRASILAHARVVAQSATAAEPKRALSEAIRATPAANESKPVWRMVAGVVLGLAGMWGYQLMRPATSNAPNVAVLSPPPSAKATAPEATASAAAPAAQETAIALNTPAKAATEVSDRPARGRTSATSRSAPAQRAELAAPNTTQTAVAATSATPLAATATTSAIPEVATSEPYGETAVASVELRKSAARAGAVARPSTAAAPNPFPAPASSAIAAAAAPAVASATAPKSAAAGDSAAIRESVGNTADAALFSAIRIGDVNALRTAVARGANVNARDEAGRSALQIARERNLPEIVKALDLAGAK